MAPPPPSIRLWRIFPWDRAAPAGEPYSASFVPGGQVSGRFDLGGRPPVLYLAESPTHAVGEKIQRYRGQVLEQSELREFGRPLALSEVSLTLSDPSVIADLCDPSELLRFRCRPDELMSREVARTQAVSRRLYDAGLAGFRLWSALSGDWHSSILYLDRVEPGSMAFSAPYELELTTPAVQEAAQLLAISIRR
ncbi:MAG: RES family NAD+ phosphorylase [Gemmatimonadales bacterium]